MIFIKSFSSFSDCWFRFPGEENDYPFQYSCLETSMDLGAWQATVNGIAKSWTWQSDQYFQLSISEKIFPYRRFTHIPKPNGTYTLPCMQMNCGLCKTIIIYLVAQMKLYINICMHVVKKMKVMYGASNRRYLKVNKMGLLCRRVRWGRLLTFKKVFEVLPEVRLYIPMLLNSQMEI